MDTLPVYYTNEPLQLPTQVKVTASSPICLALNAIISMLPTDQASLDNFTLHEVLTMLHRVAPLPVTSGHFSLPDVERFIVSVMNMLFGCIKGSVSGSSNKIGIVMRSQRCGITLLSQQEWKRRFSHLKLDFPLWLSSAKSCAKVSFVTKSMDFTSLWLKSTDRRFFTSMTLLPSIDPSNLSTWSPLRLLSSVEAQRCDDRTLQSLVQAFYAYIFQVWCAGDRVKFDFTIAFLASMIHRPFAKLAMAFVFRSQLPLRYDPVMNKLATLFGEHQFVHASKEDCLGHFNGSLRSGVAVAIDDFEPRPAMLQKLHTMLTQERWQVSQRGVPVIEQDTPRFVFLRTTSNFTLSGVKMFVTSIGESSRELTESVQAVPIDAIYESLRRVPIELAQSIPLPVTMELEQMVLASLSPVQRWWCECLQSGQILSQSHKFGMPITREVLFDCFKEWLKTTKPGMFKGTKAIAVESFWTQLTLIQSFVATEVLGIPCWLLPSLQAAKVNWDAYLRAKLL